MPKPKLSEPQARVLRRMRDGERIRFSYAKFDFGAHYEDGGRVHFGTYSALEKRRYLVEQRDGTLSPRGMAFIAEKGRRALAEHEGA